MDTDISAIEEFLTNLTNESQFGRVDPAIALSPELVDMKFFAPVLVGAASATDPMFEGLRAADVVGSHMLMPHDWLPSAESVISVFFPFSTRVTASNSAPDEPSMEWLHARIEGQSFINFAMNALRDDLISKGFEAVVPSDDQRFATTKEGTFSSNWSERHVAHICGLGTFGLSAGLITTRGVAGRFGSVVTNAEIKTSARNYRGPFDYCANCGVCIARCPIGAIDEHGKNHALCSMIINKTKENHAPRYGCGKCQTQVPCQSEVPKKVAG